jgi:RNA polymerase sigma-70 factor (ECF subfamily)
MWARPADQGARMDSAEPASLRAQLAHGDEAALAECFGALCPLVRRYLLRLVPPDDVDDVIQIVLIELWRCRDRYDLARSLEAWVLGIARKRAIDHLRARHWVTVPLDDAVPVRGGAVAFADQIEQAHDVGKALAALPTVQREAITLAYFDDLTQREIAQTLDVPLGTVKARTVRGLRRLGELLAA